jgi:hypothetical protein
VHSRSTQARSPCQNFDAQVAYLDINGYTLRALGSSQPVIVLFWRLLVGQALVLVKSAVSVFLVVTLFRMRQSPVQYLIDTVAAAMTRTGVTMLQAGSNSTRHAILTSAISSPFPLLCLLYSFKDSRFNQFILCFPICAQHLVPKMDDNPQR